MTCALLRRCSTLVCTAMFAWAGLAAVDAASSGCVLGTPLYESKKPDCPAGFYCKNLNVSDATTFPVVCMPTAECQLKRLSGNLCDAQGLHEPVLCPDGFYCPTNEVVPVACPEGHFCPAGSVSPKACSFWAVCPAQSGRQTGVGPVIVMIIVDVGITVLLIMCRRLEASQVRHLRRTRSAFMRRLQQQTRGIVSAAASKAERDEDFRVAGMFVSEGICRAWTFDNAREANQENAAVQIVTTAQLEHEARQLEMERSRMMAVATVSNDVLPLSATSESTIPILPQEPSFHMMPAQSLAVVRMNLVLTVRDLEYHLADGQQLLRNVNTEFKAGRLAAIMGPSGSGKSTLLHCIFGKQQITGGTMTLNKEPFRPEYHRSLVGLVPQDDIMFRSLTVREILLHSARTRLPASWLDHSIVQFVDAVIRLLDLDHIALTRIGDESERGISGGERKRVNVGIELVAAPAILALDEPTSGLDSAAALVVMQVLKRISSLGIMVVAVIHQPRREVFELIDDLLVMAPSGEPSFHGPRSEALLFFERRGYGTEGVVNPADFLLDVTAGLIAPAVPTGFPSNGSNEAARLRLKGAMLSVKGAHTIRAAAETTRKMSKVLPNRETPSFPQQLGANVLRGWLLQYRQARQVIVEVLGLGAAGVAMGAGFGFDDSHPQLYHGTYLGKWILMTPAPNIVELGFLGLFVVMCIGMTCVPPAVRMIGDALPVFGREAAAGQSRAAFYYGTFVSALPRFALVGFHFSACFYCLAKLSGTFSEQMVGAMCFVMFINVLGGFVSVVASKTNPLIIMLVLSGLQIVTCGFSPTVTQLRNAGVGFIFDSFPAKNLAEIYYASEMRDWGHVFDTKTDSSFFGYDLHDYGGDVWRSIVASLVMTIFTYVALLWHSADQEQHRRVVRRHLSRLKCWDWCRRRTAVIQPTAQPKRATAMPSHLTSAALAEQGAPEQRCPNPSTSTQP